MGVIIGSARLGENGHITGGAAGDQTGREVSTQAFYVHSKGWYILRPKAAAVAKRIAERMRAACNNPNLGYDQNGRYGVLKYGIDTKTPTECDCSSLVRACIKEATNKDVGDFSTASEAGTLEASGLFEKRKKYTSGTTLFTGDVLVSCTKGHTVIVTSGASRTDSGSSSGGSSLNKSEKFKGKVTATELNVRSWAGTENDVLRALPKGKVVSVCDEVKAKDGAAWYYIKESGKYGFVSAKYIAKV